MIDMFTIGKFETALPTDKKTGQPLWRSIGLDHGEYTYIIPVKPGVNIQIRSSIRSNGLAASTGKDSIRMYLIDDNGNNLGSKVNRWTTRVVGWQERLTSVLTSLYCWGLQVSDCPDCGKPMKLARVRDPKSANYKRLFTKCWDHNHFRWVQEKPKSS